MLSVKRTSLKGSPLDKLVVHLEGKEFTYYIDPYLKDVNLYVKHAEEVS